MSLQPTFGDWRDRLTYLLAEAQLLVAGVLVSSGIMLWWWSPSIPSAPAWALDLLVGSLILSPPLFIVGVRFTQWVRTRNWVRVYHVNAVEDVVATYEVPPEVWQEKTVEGPGPWPVNGKSAWAVREYDWEPETETLTVRGVWLSSMEDTRLLTSKRHMESLYGTLIEKYLELSALRDHVSEMGAEVQESTLNAAAEAREKGLMLDPSVVQETVDDHRDDAETRYGEDDLPTLDDVELPTGAEDPLAPVDDAGGLGDGGEL
jgi:hypothetical protein